MDARTRLLSERFGLPSFHPWQREAIDALLDARKPVLVVAPTGGGKSLCYQFPACELPGTTVVVSPLIALMEDQVRALSQRGIAATYLASTLELGEQRRRMEQAEQGAFDIVYVAPERLANPHALSALERLRPVLLAIDEAHCISQWGHDFRPDYLRLNRVLERLAPPHVLACTATATPRVREEIIDRLGLSHEGTAVVLRGFARPNLHLAALEVDAQKKRREVTLATLVRHIGEPGRTTGAAIVYAGTRKATDLYATLLAQRGYRAAAYHAGLEGEHRARVNREFVTGALDVVAATNAFGMGIDRADIRTVVHVNAPGSIEAYYQEVGRAGRDGQPAHGVLITGASDLGLRRRLIDLGGGGETRSERMDQQWSLFLDLMRYVEAGSCRHDFILRYFGDEAETLGGCGHCDVCEHLLEVGGEARATPEQDLLVVRKALSGVARGQGRAGMRAICEMLHGKSTRKIESLGFTQLSTHGLLSEHPVEWIVALLRRLVTAGLVEVTADAYPMPYLTPAGVEVMKGSRKACVLLPAPDAGVARSRGRSAGKPSTPDGKPSTPDIALSEEAERLFAALKQTRLQLARERGVPAYVICPDRTLVAIAEAKPVDEGTLASMYGMGPARIEAYGAELLQAVREHARV